MYLNKVVTLPIRLCICRFKKMKVFVFIFLLFISLGDSGWAKNFDLEKSRAKTSPSNNYKEIYINKGKAIINGKKVDNFNVNDFEYECNPKHKKCYNDVTIKDSTITRDGVSKKKFTSKGTSSYSRYKAKSNLRKYKKSTKSIGISLSKQNRSETHNDVDITNSIIEGAASQNIGTKLKGNLHNNRKSSNKVRVKNSTIR